MFVYIIVFVYILYMCVCVCVYIYIHTFTHTYTCVLCVYVYIYTHTHTCRLNAINQFNNANKNQTVYLPFWPRFHLSIQTSDLYFWQTCLSFAGLQMLH